ncbi:18359_t:CDS:2 [Funneliformis geosporum]|uniref:5341_t:CDS:1 n=1 Tax=Funneliformis geosporum TaxID=1117311 RepID=A0A9W4SLZ3_9GLOM|nr:18359_t:CDS:2 [Funneliformis geosporum]CAI2173258.1 5341_t:CDS:2 [Funneliformis geosporum]
MTLHSKLSSETRSNGFSENGNTGNKFGRGIEFREGAPMQLLRYEVDNGKFGKIVLNQEALDVLKRIREPLAIISVVGSYRRGKSWFANVLHGRHDGFDLGAKVEGCTRGIYMWSPPFTITSKQSDGSTIQKRVIVFDSEGIDDPKQDQNWATKLFILCLASSSTFIYNINGIVGRDDIGKLYLMTDLSKFIQEPEDGDFLPRLVILLRDFTLENPDSFKDYFLEKLQNVNPEAAAGIGRFFYDFNVYGLPHPGCKRKMLQHLEDAQTDELDEEFVDEVENTVKEIYSQLPLKYIGSSTMKGTAFVKFLQDIVERMNSSETSTLLSIPSEYESIIQFVAQEAIKESTILYQERMDVLNEEGKLPMLWEDFGEIHEDCMSDVNKLFFEKVIGSPTQMESFIGRLNEDINKCKEVFLKKNSEELTIHNEHIAKTFWEKYVKSGLTHENLFESTDKFQEALENFELAFEKTMMKSPEAAKVIASYMQDQYPTAIDYMTQLGKMNAELAKAMIAKEEAERLRLESIAREEEFRMEMEGQKREREETERLFKIKMLELETNIEEQQRAHEDMKYRLIEERERVVEKYNQKMDEMQEAMVAQQKLNDDSNKNLLDEQQRQFEQIQRSAEDKNRRLIDELSKKLSEEKEKAIENQNQFYQKHLSEQIKATQKQTEAILETMKRENNDLRQRISDSTTSGPCLIS